MKTHLGVNNMAICGASALMVKQCTQQLECVDCLGCLWSLVQQLHNQLKTATDRVRLVSNEAINTAEYRLGPKVTT